MKNKRMKKIGISIAILLAMGITAYCGWAAWENWTGARAWKETQEKLIAENVELDFKKLIPAMPREEDNFARTPMIASATDYDLIPEPNFDVVYRNPELREQFQTMVLPKFEDGNPLPSWQLGRNVDLELVRTALSRDGDGETSVLEWMSQFNTEFAELDAAAMRPEAQLPVEVGETFLDHVNTILPFLSELRDYQKLQTVRACAALEAGDTAQAKAAVQTSFQLHRASASHPTLIGFLVGRASLDQTLSVIWQGMEMNAWTADDLIWIEEELKTVELLDDLERALTFEMVTFQIGAGKFLKNLSRDDSRELVKMVGEMGSTGGDNSSRLGMLALAVPSGVWDHNVSVGCEAVFEHMIRPVRERRLPDDKVIERLLEKRGLHNFLPSLTLPAITTVAQRGFESTVAVELAQLACAIERFKTSNGDYPDSLDQLIPDFIEKIPMDLMAEGKTLNYKKGGEGDRYRIYSVGKNQTDEGGKVEFNDKKSRRDLDNGDWAWGFDFEFSEKKKKVKKESVK